MLKKMTVLAMAVGLVAALALPAAASANWKHNGAALGVNKQLTFRGPALFQSELGGAHCLVDANVQFTANSTAGHAETFDPVGTDTEGCQGTGGLAFCDIHNVNPTNLNWAIQTTEGLKVSIANGEIDSTTTGTFCPMKKLVVTPATVTGTANAAKVTSITLSGNIQVDAQTKNPEEQTDILNAQAGGTLQIVNAADRNTYEI